MTPHTGTITKINREFYDALWWKARLQRPDRFNTWPLVSELLPRAAARLELGPGLRPRLPIAGTHFIDLSPPAVAQLNARGGKAMHGEIDALPFRDASFDLVCAFDVIEHVDDDQRAFGEIRRVLKPGGVLICSVPLHTHCWTAFDDWVGHARRYEPADLLAILARHQFTIERSGGFGMQPSNPRLLNYGMWWLERHRAWAMFWYNWVGMPLAMRFQSPLRIATGLVDTAPIDEIVIVCRRSG